MSQHPAVIDAMIGRLGRSRCHARHDSDDRLHDVDPIDARSSSVTVFF
jgi:hypothetical protein